MKIKIKRKDKIVGWLKLSPLKHNGDIEIEYLFIEKDFRGKGIASLLIQKAKKKAKTLVAFIEPHPESSLTFEQECEWLKRNGFVNIKKYDFGDCKKPVMFWSDSHAA